MKSSSTNSRIRLSIMKSVIRSAFSEIFKVFDGFWRVFSFNGFSKFSRFCEGILFFSIFEIAWLWFFSLREIFCNVF